MAIIDYFSGLPLGARGDGSWELRLSVLILLIVLANKRSQLQTKTGSEE